MVDTVIFWTFATLAVVGGFQLVFNRSLIYAALGLLMTFLSIAGLFLLNNADFLAIAQVLVYAVGLTIIILFAIMFTGDKSPAANLLKPANIGYGLVTTYMVIALFAAIKYPFNFSGGSARAMFGGGAFGRIATEGSSGQLGLELFQNYGLPFELASLLLLVAMIGAIVISKKQFADQASTSVKYSLPTQSRIPEEAREDMEKSMNPSAVSKDETPSEEPSTDAQEQEEPVGAAQ